MLVLRFNREILCLRDGSCNQNEEDTEAQNVAFRRQQKRNLERTAVLQSPPLPSAKAPLSQVRCALQETKTLYHHLGTLKSRSEAARKRRTLPKTDAEAHLFLNRAELHTIPEKNLSKST